MLLYYEILLGLSIMFSLAYAFMWHKHFDVNITLVFFLVPLNILAHLGVAKALTIDEAVLALKLIYFTTVFSILFVTFSIFDLCHLKLPRIARGSLICISMLIYLPVLTIGYNDMYYKSVDIVTRNGITVMTGKEYGVFHTILYLWIFACFAFCVGALIYSHVKKSDVSHKIIYFLFIPVFISMLSFFIGRKVTSDIELAAASYVFAQFFYLLIVYRLALYNIIESGIDTLIQNGDTAFISFDYRLRYLGSNETAKQWLPFLKDLHVDQSVRDNEKCKSTIIAWIKAFNGGEITDENPIHYHSEDGQRILDVTVNHLFDGRKNRGYQFFITDDTADVKNIEFQEKFNTVLRFEVDQKTQHILFMNNHLLISMATMVESRDPFTGGHIKRTSEGVRILVAEMKNDPEVTLSKKFYESVVKAAPMHDLGKIAVPDAVLLKPGRYEPEEYEIMKSHSAEGARVVKEILSASDDMEFRRIAENVAHFHHERWDGKGYPNQLSGNDIPIEARIMAVADVYDALVSKRVYKEKMPFEKANAIILEGMGTQFDPALRKYYEAAREKLEAYYESQLEADATQKEEKDQDNA
ncbi:MAG: HD domain-containing protein [Clostridiales bacterium]|nr:HD domain-containing protein [Clostridiales bacterium]